MNDNTSNPRSPDLSESSLGLGQIFTITVGTIIGIGWITMLGLWLQQAGPLGAILAFLGGVMVILPIVFCYGELATALPRMGGEIAWLEAVGGWRAGFAAGWLLLLTFLSVIAFEAVSTGWIISALFPVIGEVPTMTVAGLILRPGEMAVAITVMAGIVLAQISTASGFGRLQDFATYGKLAVSALFIMAGLVFGSSANLAPLMTGTDAPDQWRNILALLVTTPFWFAGFNAAAQAIGERNGKSLGRGVGATLVAAVLTSLAFYCLVIAAASMAAPRAAILAHPFPAAGAFEALFGTGMAKLVLLAGLLGLVSTWNAVTFAAVRVLGKLSRDAMLPRWVGGKGAIVITVACGLTGIVLGRPIIGTVVNASAACVSLLFLLVALATLRLRRDRPQLDRPYRMPGGGIMGILATLCAASLLVLYLLAAVSGPHMVSDDLQILVVWLYFGGWLMVRAHVGRSQARRSDR